MPLQPTKAPDTQEGEPQRSGWGVARVYRGTAASITSNEVQNATLIDTARPDRQSKRRFLGQLQAYLDPTQQPAISFREGFWLQLRSRSVLHKAVR